MPKPISRAEFDVMEALWRESPLAAADVADAMPDSGSRSVKTVKTLLSRLVDKGAVAHDVDGRRYLYSPILSRDEYAQTVTSQLADQLSDGRAAPLVAHLATGRGLSEEDIAELEILIADLKRIEAKK
ncbi:MAG: BlaI/MecI/CopY family transcriptional regulator [Marinicaulis sp.]|nr:BlaI/MecI/CopY family transcriptional regulator [Marinicaulis sp.]NNE39667.1 BlaI/MecI/CopY family transcriptional regulator [Marinicaulis sp.]NNL90415.1 BlaI/MecI/CopY family transcriptional regulator [Marinicaulis sp.]